jgi:hypothetical protein
MSLLLLLLLLLLSLPLLDLHGTQLLCAAVAC